MKDNINETGQTKFEVYQMEQKNEQNQDEE